MSLQAPQPSKRFRRAAESERASLLAHHQRLAAERDRLQAEMDDVVDAIMAVEDQLRVLARVIGAAEDEMPAASEPFAGGIMQDSEEITAARVLSGPAVRETAVQVLLHQPRYIEAIHYREWYGLLVAAGYAVAGKKPEAVFLTQITRSPVVHKAVEPGIYELDRQAPLKLRQRFERLQGELRDLSSVTARDAGSASNAAKRRELTAAIGQTEKELDEALRVLRRDEGSDQRLTA